MGDTGKKVGGGIGTVGGGVVGAYFGGPVGAMAGAGIGGGIGSLFGSIFDSPDDEAPGTQTPATVDPSLYQYGGSPEAYGQAMQQYGSGLSGSEKRLAPELDWGTSAQDYNDAHGVLGQQQSEADRLRDILAGKGGPSLAEQQMQRGLATNSAMAAQLAASARGGAGNQLLAVRDAERQAALGGLAVNRDSGEARLREQQMAGQQYEGLLGTMRGQSLQSRAGSLQEQGLISQNELAQRGLNDQQARAYLSAEQGAIQGKTNADIALGSAQLQAQMGVQGINSQAAQAANASSNALLGGMVGTGGALAAAGVGAMGKNGGGGGSTSPGAAVGSSSGPVPSNGSSGWGSTGGSGGGGGGAGLGYGGSSDIEDPWGKNAGYGKVSPVPSAGAGTGDKQGTPYGLGGSPLGGDSSDPYDPHHRP